MWPLKLAGGLLVVAASAALGFYRGLRGRMHIDELLEMKKALFILQSEIEYARNPLGDACQNAADRLAGTAARFMGCLANCLTDGQTSAGAAWDEAAALTFPQSRLDGEDADNLSQIGRTLGYLDKDMQLAGLGLAAAYIDAKAARLEATSAKDSRLYGSVGVIGGLMVWIVLL